ncbi:MAG TPA: F0F1 ATP synthase subunit A [Candidatus Polarisedimenticolaceae bacterium]|nr:F0F1 ATP synthase subunit A [Candidatus Polarisedimenticolaceae bacterium]
MTGNEPAVVEQGGHASGAFDPGTSILHHILDSHELEIPFVDWKIPLPQWHVGGLDLSITKHVVMMWIVCGILLLAFGMAARRRFDPVPRGLHNALEALVQYLRNEVARPAMHEHADRYVGYLLTVFFFIWTCNLLGLVPGFATATGNISVTAGLALTAFAMIQFGGIREYGVVGHFRNLVPHGLPPWLIPLMIVLELLSMLIRPFALCIRLFANMMAGHIVILAFISLIFILATMGGSWLGWVASPLAVFLALFVHFLELLVATVQAYIFTMLTAQFIGLSLHPH